MNKACQFWPLAVLLCLAQAAPAADEKKDDQAGDTLSIDKEKKLIAIPCKIAPRKLPELPEIYQIEVIAVSTAAKKIQKAHETIVTIGVKPSEVHKALEDLGLKPGKPAKGEGASATGPEVKMSLELSGASGKPTVVPIEKCLIDKKTGKALPPLKWRFTGSALVQLDPEKPDKVYGADASGTLISIFPVTDETVLQSHLTLAEEELLDLETNKTVLPAEGTAARLLIQVK